MAWMTWKEMGFYLLYIAVVVIAVTALVYSLYGSSDRYKNIFGIKGKSGLFAEQLVAGGQGLNTGVGNGSTGTISFDTITALPESWVFVEGANNTQFEARESGLYKFDYSINLLSSLASSSNYLEAFVAVNGEVVRGSVSVVQVATGFQRAKLQSFQGQSFVDRGDLVTLNYVVIAGGAWTVPDTIVGSLSAAQMTITKLERISRTTDVGGGSKTFWDSGC